MRVLAAGGLAIALILSAMGWSPGGDAARMQGSWKVVAVEDSGVPSSEPFLKTRQYVFDGSKMLVRARGAPPLSWESDLVERLFKSPTFRLYPAATPKEIDLILPGYSTMMRGIYDIDGDRLKICFSGPSGKAAMTRPTGFSVPGSGARLVVLEREGNGSAAGAVPQSEPSN